MSKVNPQLEDGYTPVANPIMDALAHTQLTGREWRVLCFVLRKTYGWQKKADRLSLSQFVDGTGIERRHIIEAIKGLVQKRILTSDSAKIGTRAVRTYGFNKHFGEWVIVPKSALVPKTVKRIVPKSAPTISIETNTTRDSFNGSRKQEPAKTKTLEDKTWAGISSGNYNPHKDRYHQETFNPDKDEER